MSLHISRPRRIFNICYAFVRKVSNSNEEKSIYQRYEEGTPERTVHGELYPEWRKQWIQRPGEWYSKFSVFVDKNPNKDVLYVLQQIPDFNLTVLKEWWASMKEIQERENQRYIPRRVQILGPNLAAMHYFTYRGATVRLKDSKDWIMGDPIMLQLPTKFKEGYFVEAIDCSGFKKGGIRYEGLSNLAELNFLKWLSLRNNKHVDEWGIDKIAGQNGKTIEYLDIRGITLRTGCVYALARMTALKVVVITDPGDNMELQAAFSILEQTKPHLLIKIDQEDATTANVTKS